MAHEGVEREELDEDVGDVDDLAEEVQDNEVVALTTSAHHAAGAREQVLQADRAACLEVFLTCQVPEQRKNIILELKSRILSVHV